MHDAVLDGHILNIIQRDTVCEQSDLQTMLKEKGYDIPQATLSRRLKKLNIAKVSGVYTLVGFAHPSLPPILSMQISDFGLIVLHTHPGQANSIAYFLDQKYVKSFSYNASSSGILGTIAGDDTILLIIKSKADLDTLLPLLYTEFPYLARS